MRRESGRCRIADMLAVEPSLPRRARSNTRVGGQRALVCLRPDLPAPSRSRAASSLRARDAPAGSMARCTDVLEQCRLTWPIRPAPAAASVELGMAARRPIVRWIVHSAPPLVGPLLHQRVVQPARRSSSSSKCRGRRAAPRPVGYRLQLRESVNLRARLAEIGAIVAPHGRVDDEPFRFEQAERLANRHDADARGVWQAADISRSPAETRIAGWHHAAVGIRTALGDVPRSTGAAPVGTASRHGRPSWPAARGRGLSHCAPPSTAVAYTSRRSRGRPPSLAAEIQQTTSPLVLRAYTLPLANTGAVKALPSMTWAEPSSL